jgi:DNA-binding transcriptional regulator GbsR (MarR family)
VRRKNGLLCSVDELQRRFAEYIHKTMRGHDASSTRQNAYGVYYTQKKPLTLAALENDLPGI